MFIGAGAAPFRQPDIVGTRVDVVVVEEVQLHSGAVSIGPAARAAIVDQLRLVRQKVFPIPPRAAGVPVSCSKRRSGQTMRMAATMGATVVMNGEVLGETPYILKHDPEQGYPKITVKKRNCRGSVTSSIPYDPEQAEMDFSVVLKGCR